MSWAEAAVAHHPEHGAAWLALARCRVDLGRYEAAAEAVPPLRRLLPDEAAAAELRGRIALELGRREEALAAYGELERLAPEDPAGALGLALVAARLDRDWPTLRARLFDAEALDPRLQPAMLPLRAAWAPLAEDAEFLAALREYLREPAER